MLRHLVRLKIHLKYEKIQNFSLALQADVPRAATGAGSCLHWITAQAAVDGW